MGRPADLSRAQVAELKTLSAGKPASIETVTVSAAGVFEKTLPLRENEVFLLSLVPE
jgi:xylan 1,4-beta-xylosidase